MTQPDDRWPGGAWRAALRVLSALLMAAAAGAAGAQAWTPVPDSGFVTAVAAAPDGRLVGVGTDRLLWTRASLQAPWVQVPGSGFVVSVALRPDGSLVGVGTDQQLWTRAHLNAAWVQVPNSGSVVGVAVMPSGVIVGVGTDGFLWQRATIDSAWARVPDSGSVTAVAARPDGSLVGVGRDQALWTRATLASPWVAVPNSGAVIGVAARADGSLVGIGTDKTLWTWGAAGAQQAQAEAPCKECPPWVARSFTANHLPLAATAEVWSRPKPFQASSGPMTVQSRFMGQQGTTCRFEVQFNNPGPKPLDERLLIARPDKAAVGGNDFPLTARLAPGTHVAYATEVRQCPLNWGETKDMDKCAACEPQVYFLAR
ncbi:WD40 repeat domain-containing protein [Ideonella alba]|uniref:Uncharacterized protein n=1 Tax=Ideonella alba TaxID=2824118 RepID=A0A941BFH5_9BURK|nr:tectonin domain-containing protein [Ideonella alba]MBQ0932086.1 hypothetical protein [Ideonella alba]